LDKEDVVKDAPCPTLKTDKSSVYVDYAGNSELIMVCASKWDDGDEGRTFGFSRPKAEFRKFAEDILKMMGD
jgi:hypothetical protein